MLDRHHVNFAKRARFLFALAIAFAVVESGYAGEAGFATARLNLRECPRADPDCPVLGVLDRGAELEVLDREQDWLRVRVVADDREGWVAARYVRGENPDRTAGSADPRGSGGGPTFLSRVRDIAIGLGLLVVIFFLGAIAFGPRSPTVRIPGPASGSNPSSDRW